MPIIINPLMVDNAEHIALLRALLEKNKACIEWKANKEFTVLFQEAEHQLQLTHTIFLASLINGRLSYRIIANAPRGKGNASVYDVVCLFSFSHENTIELHAQDMVLKTQGYPLDNDCILNKLIFSSLREYDFSSRTHHLGMERPIFTYTQDATPMIQVSMFMNRMEGVELFDIILTIERSGSPVSSKFLFTLTIELLKAYKDQVLDREIILHADVKPENIMVDLGLSKPDLSHILKPNFSPQHVIIKLIDYAFCVTPDEIMTCGRGTLEYAAPEMKNIITPTSFNNEKPDIYSLGICIKLLWLRNYGNISSEKIHNLYDQYYGPESASFSKEKLTSIYNAIINMTHANPQQRWSLNESIEAFGLLAGISMTPAAPGNTTLSDLPFTFFKSAEQRTVSVSNGESLVDVHAPVSSDKNMIVPEQGLFPHTEADMAACCTIA